MFDEIISLDNLFAAWREFRRGKRGKRDVQAFERKLEDHLYALHRELEDGTYVHDPYERFHIFDPKFRIIHKAIVRDRIVHHAIHRVIVPIFDGSFIYDSYSCRVGKGTHMAVERLRTFARRVSHEYEGPCWALKCDIRKFFDSMNHEILFELLTKRIDCMKTLGLLRSIIESYPPVDKIQERERELKVFPSGT